MRRSGRPRRLLLEHHSRNGLRDFVTVGDFAVAEGVHYVGRLQPETGAFRWLM